MVGRASKAFIDYLLGLYFGGDISPKNILSGLLFEGVICNAYIWF